MKIYTTHIKSTSPRNAYEMKADFLDKEDAFRYTFSTLESFRALLKPNEVFTALVSPDGYVINLGDGYFEAKVVESDIDGICPRINELVQETKQRRESKAHDIKVHTVDKTKN